MTHLKWYGGLVSTAIATAICATAFTAALISYAIADAAWLHPFLYGNPNDIFVPRLLSSRSQKGAVDIPEEFVASWKTEFGPDGVGTYRREWLAVDLGAGPREAWVIRISGGLIRLTELTAVLGREFTAEEEKTGGVALLTYDAWRSQFGGAHDVLGRWIRVGGSKIQIIGVAPRTFVLPNAPKTAVFLPLGSPSDASMGSESPVDFRGRSARVLFRSSVSPEQLRERCLAAIAARLDSLPPEVGRLNIQVLPVAAAAQPEIAAAPVFFGMIACIVLLSLVSFGYLEAANFAVLGPIAAIHLALGARIRTIRLMVFKRITAPLILSFLLSMGLTHALLMFLGADLQTSLGLDRSPVLTTSIIGAASAVLIAVLLLGSAALSTHLCRLLQRGAFSLTTTGRGTSVVRRTTRRIIVATQLACSGALLTLAGAAAGLFLSLVNTDLGLDPSNVLAATAVTKATEHHDIDAAFGVLQRELASSPGVSAVSLVDIIPFGGFPFREMVAVDRGMLERTKVRRVDDQYFRVLRLRTIAGRVISEADIVSPPSVVVVSAGFAAQRLEGNPLNQSVRVGERTLHIIGVVADVRDQDLDRAAEPTVYIPNSDPQGGKYFMRGVLVRVTPTDQRAARELERVFAHIKGAAAVNATVLTRLEDHIGDVFVTPSTYAALTGAFGWVALVLAIFGTYSVSAQVAAQRRREIAVRMACGATRAKILNLFGRDALLPVGVGLLLGASAGGALASTVADTAFQASPVPLWSILLATGLLGACAFIAVLVPAAQTASLNPSGTLRGE